MSALQAFAKDKEAALKIIEYSGSFAALKGGSYDCSVIHKDITINENHPKINLNLRKAYQNIYNRYKINIRSYNSRFTQILKAQVTQREEKHQFGSGITSKRLGDIKKRYWYRNVQGEDVPDMAVMLLIDGSGSMAGERKNAAMQSAVILHEVLKKQGITHSIVEHRAGFDEPEIDVNILVRFNGNDEEKLNIMQIDAYGDNRDGLALFWAERYMAKNTTNDHRLIIVLSDGLPAHEADDYYPPVSTKDTANAVKKITKRGTDIIGISLDQPGVFDTYEQLSQIYPNLVACNDLSRLTGQLLGIIAKLI
jgi:nitric oxide reductase activation protein